VIERDVDDSIESARAFLGKEAAGLTTAELAAIGPAVEQPSPLSVSPKVGLRGGCPVTPAVLHRPDRARRLMRLPARSLRERWISDIEDYRQAERARVRQRLAAWAALGLVLWAAAVAFCAMLGG